MDMKQLAYFVSIAQNGSYSRTAKEFYMTQPAVSRQIIELERELGVKLFTRNTRRVNLTREGEVFIEDARRMLALQEQADQRLRELQFAPDQHLSIAYLPEATKRYLPTVMRSFLKEYPYVDISFARKNAGELIRGLQEEQFDLYFSNVQDFAVAADYELWTIQSDPYGLVTLNDHSLVQEPLVDYARLSGEPFVMLDPKVAAHMNNQVREICARLGITPRVAHYYSNMQELIFAVESGFGSAILPGRMADDISSDACFFPLKVTGVVSEIAVAWKRSGDNPMAAKFLKTLSDVRRERPELF